MSVCVNCIIHANMCTQTTLCVSGLTDLFSLFSHLFHMPAVPSQSLPHLSYGTGQIKLVIVVCDLPASSAGLGLVLEGAKVGSCDCAWAAISCVIKSWIFLEIWLWCWCFRTKGKIRWRISLSDSSSFLLNVPSIFTDLEGSVQVVLLLPCSSSLFLAPSLILPCSWSPCIFFHLTAGFCSIIPFNGAWWCFVLCSETGIRLHPALFCC